MERISFGSGSARIFCLVKWVSKADDVAMTPSRGFSNSPFSYCSESIHFFLFLFCSVILNNFPFVVFSFFFVMLISCDRRLKMNENNTDFGHIKTPMRNDILQQEKNKHILVKWRP